jgi:hypothetical protein
MAYLLEKLPLGTLIAPVTRASVALVRLDERLARSPVRFGWIERSHFADATAALWLEGELVHLEDLILHHAHMNVRAPTHELTRAYAVLRARRKILSRPSNWPFSEEGMRQLTGIEGNATPQVENGGECAGPLSTDIEADTLSYSLDEEFAIIDAALDRAAMVLEGKNQAQTMVASRNERPSLVYDLDWNERDRLAKWQSIVVETRDLPAVLRAAILVEAWAEIEVLQHAAWLGPLLVAALLRDTGIAAHHLPCMHLGAKTIPRERRLRRNGVDRLLASVDAIHEMALAGLKQHDRLMLVKNQMERKLRNRRANSKLPDLVELVLSRPLVSTGMIQESLKVSTQGALNLVGELGLREMTGRGRFRAWGVV